MANDSRIIERPTLSMTKLRGLYLVVHPRISPSDSDWDALISFHGKDLRAMPRDHEVKVLVYSEGGGPNAAQRRRMIQFLEARRSTTAVLTASTAVRAIVTAFSWFRTDIRAFAPHDIAGAASYLGLQSRTVPEVRDQLNRMLARWDSSVRLPPGHRIHTTSP